MRVWDAASGVELACLRGHAGVVLSVAYSPDGRRIVSGSQDQTVRVWDADSGVELACLRGHAGSVMSVAYSPDGRRIVSGSDDETVRVWDAASGVELACLRGHAGPVYERGVFPRRPPHRQRVDDKTVRVWDAASGVELACLRGHEGEVDSVAYSPDGRHIVSGSSDSTVRMWDAASGAELACLRGHENAVNSVAYSPDGRRIVSQSMDKTVRVWDATSGECLEVIQGSDDARLDRGGGRGVSMAGDEPELETVIEPAGGGEAVPGSPPRWTRSRPTPPAASGPGRWDDHLYLIRLEGEPDSKLAQEELRDERPSDHLPAVRLDRDPLPQVAGRLGLRQLRAQVGSTAPADSSPPSRSQSAALPQLWPPRCRGAGRPPRAGPLALRLRGLARHAEDPLGHGLPARDRGRSAQHPARRGPAQPPRRPRVGRPEQPRRPGQRLPRRAPLRPLRVQGADRAGHGRFPARRRS